MGLFGFGDHVLDELASLAAGSDDEDLDVMAADLGGLVRHLGELAGAAGVKDDNQHHPRAGPVAVLGAEALQASLGKGRNGSSLYKPFSRQTHNQFTINVIHPKLFL